MSNDEGGFHVRVDPTNPGQFFACCGLLELADRLLGGAEGWFERGRFRVRAKGELAGVIDRIARVELSQINPNDNTSSPILMALPDGPLRLDWWLDDRAGGKELKVWAGTMESVRIARAMQHAMQDEPFRTPRLFDVGLIAFDPDDSRKKVEPYYFDARRCPNAHSRDVGFSPNDLSMTTTAYPAVEFLCLVGLQRSLPARTDRPRVFAYHTWTIPIPPCLMPPAVSGLLPHEGQRGYRFENWYRTGQRKHKAFRTATPMKESENR